LKHLGEGHQLQYDEVSAMLAELITAVRMTPIQPNGGTFSFSSPKVLQFKPKAAETELMAFDPSDKTICRLGTAKKDGGRGIVIRADGVVIGTSEELFAYEPFLRVWEEQVAKLEAGRTDPPAA
jgi:hypothetical protein